MPKYKKRSFKLAQIIAVVALLSHSTPGAAENWNRVLAGITLGDQTDQMADDNRLPPLGMRLGYGLDLGQIILGGEVEVEPSSRQVASATLQGMQRLSLRAGYDFGQTLGYLFLGGVRVENGQDHETGAEVGLGLSYTLNQNFRLGGEVRYLDIDGLDHSNLRRSNSFSVRASFQF